MHYISGKNIYPKSVLNHANVYRHWALEIDSNPAAIKKYVNHPAITGYTLDEIETCLQRTQQFDALSYGDVGVLLAAPGSSLAGLMVKELGNASQQALFKEYLTSKRTSTFLAVTEPARGSDAAHLTAQLTAIGSAQYTLTGEKCFIGNGAVGKMGVVIARTAPGPLGLAAVFITPDDLGTASNPHLTIQRTTIPTTGLRGASLAHMVFDGYQISESCILGGHLRIANRGLMGLLKTFNRMRTCVGALAIGLSQAMLDYTVEEVTLSESQSRSLVQLSNELSAARQVLYKAAKEIDKDVTNSAIASLAKANATKTAEKIAQSILNILDVSFYWEHPLLEKWYRDVFGFEFMEGTSHIHYKNVANQFIQQQKGFG
jgi:acyl-CoA dehydrogenase